MPTKRIIQTSLFCVWVAASYCDVWGYQASDMADFLASGIGGDPIFLSTFQRWFFSIASSIYNGLAIALVVGIFAYHFREFKTIVYARISQMD